MKRAPDGAASSGNGKSGGAAPQCTLKFLTPEALAAAIIGKGGSVIASIRQSCQAKISLSDQGLVYPTTDCRVMIAQASTEELLDEVCKQVIEKTEGLATSGGGVSEAVGHDGELKLRTLVPRAAVGGIIGKGGAAIKQMREKSEAKILISDPVGNGPASEQTMSITGSVEALEYVMREVNKQIQMLKGEPWFSSWALGTSTVSAASGSQGSGGLQLAMGGAPGAASPGIDVMMRVAQGLPPYVLEDARGFALSCVVPHYLVGGIIGRGGSGTKEVQMLTGTKISIREIPDDPDNRSLNIAGPLSSTCAAYMLMMRRYLDAEASRGRQRPR